MRYGTIEGIDKPVSRLIQGTVMISTDEVDSSLELLDGVYELGCTAFDTALVYGGGKSEGMLGRWVADRGVREKVVIVDKGAHHSSERRRVTPEDIADDVATSLERLGTDYVDLFLLHRDDPGVPVGPVVEALNEHLRAGRIRAFGGSNWSAGRVAEANEYADSHGLTGFAASSPNHSLAIPRDVPWEDCLSISGPAGAADRAWYSETQLPVLFWSSLAGGFFSGRFSRESPGGSGGDMDELAAKCYCTEESFDRLEWAQRVSAEQGLTLPQVALAWVLAEPMNVFALVGCWRRSEFEANIQALKVQLPADAPGA
ncbi:MAG: aldo/keto reductase [Planctomycetota bacterium]|jgi:aryl-alcohol dehydrogenase-like predicted oxidoreductase